MRKSTGAEKGQAVDVANGEIVAQVEIGTGAIVGQIVGINENVGGSVRGVVDGMAVSIGKAQRQVTHGASRPDLQGMINGIRRVPKRVDVVEPRECGAYGRDTRNKSASNVQVAMLNGGPDRFVGYGNDRKRKERYLSTTTTDTRIAAVRPSWASVKPDSDVGLCRGKHEWRGAFQ